VWLPPSRISSLSGPSPTMRCAAYAQLLKTLCLDGLADLPFPIRKLSLPRFVDYTFT
jgi:hypothetical protein